MVTRRGIVVGGSIITGFLMYKFNSNKENKQLLTPRALSSKDVHTATSGLLKLERNDPFKPPPSRDSLIHSLKNDTFDLLIIGGGATGVGCALDATTRGLKVALVENGDFASGTSSKSTKLLHGGVRYLEKAILQLDKSQLDLVVEALRERNNLFQVAPHLSKVLPILIPFDNYWQCGYYYAGAKLYDLLAGKQNIRSSFTISHSQLATLAPMIMKKGNNYGNYNIDSTENDLNYDMTIKDWKGALVYHDGIFNDARLCTSLALTAINYGATVVNYMQVTDLVNNSLKKGIDVIDPTVKDDKLCGAIVRDTENGDTFSIDAKMIVNATGPYTDKLLNMDKKLYLSTNIDNNLVTDTKTKDNLINEKLVVPSKGVHITLPSYYCPKNFGILDSSTTDGRVMFFIPWLDKVIAGTTDIPMENVPWNPKPTEADIQDILMELQKYINFPINRDDVLSAWAGIRPLVKSPNAVSKQGKTEQLVRSHLLLQSPSNLITITGGKWTTYREMAQETIDKVLEVGNFDKFTNNCLTKRLTVLGSQEWDSNYSTRLQYLYGINDKLANYLSENYGTQSDIICQLFKINDTNKLPIAMGTKRIEPQLISSFNYPFTIGELKYCIHYEYVRTALDFLLRRSRLAFLDAKEADLAIEGTVEVMARELDWDKTRIQKEIDATKDQIKNFIARD